MSMSRRQKIEDRAWGTICCKTGRQAWAENYLTHMDNHWRKFSSTCTRLTVNPAGEVHAYVHTGCSQASSRWPQLGYATACHLFFFLLLLLLLLFFFFCFFCFAAQAQSTQQVLNPTWLFLRDRNRSVIQNGDSELSNAPKELSGLCYWTRPFC